MHIKISGDRKVIDVVNEFQVFYPYLKLNFYTLKDGRLNGRKAYPGETRLDEIHTHVPEGCVDVPRHLSVKQLEKLFNEKFDLHVQVQRRSGNVWLETTVTDKWTLEHKNDQGREITQNIQFNEKSSPYEA